MKPFSKIDLFTAWLFCLALCAARAEETGLFSPVPAQDDTYARLSTLAKAGLLAEKDVTPPFAPE